MPLQAQEAIDRTLKAATADAMARQSYGRLIAYLAARTCDVASAEDALSDAFVAALENWPVHGVPDNPQAWLLTVSRRKLIDWGRRRVNAEAMARHLAVMTETEADPPSGEEQVPDDRLLLMLACAHPAIEESIRAPLILQTVLGFDAATIASAFLVSPSVMSQRLVRAKAKIKVAGIPFQLPAQASLGERIDCVLQAIYAAYAEGWSNASGTAVRRRNLGLDAIWLGSLVARLQPDQPEALGLLSLMLHLEARRGTRRTASGDYVPLSEQDPGGWDVALIQEAEALLFGASTMNEIGRFQLEAAIQSVHARRRLTGQTDWVAITRFYEALFLLTRSPIVAVNHAVALSASSSPADGLAALDRIGDATALASYQPYWAARAQMLADTGAITAADAAYLRAIGLEHDPEVRRFLLRRQETMRRQTPAASQPGG